MDALPPGHTTAACICRTVETALTVLHGVQGGGSQQRDHHDARDQERERSGTGTPRLAVHGVGAVVGTVRDHEEGDRDSNESHS